MSAACIRQIWVPFIIIFIVEENLQWNNGGGRWQDEDGHWVKRRRV